MRAKGIGAGGSGVVLGLLLMTPSLAGASPATGPDVEMTAFGSVEIVDVRSMDLWDAEPGGAWKAPLAAPAAWRTHAYPGPCWNRYWYDPYRYWRYCQPWSGAYSYYPAYGWSSYYAPTPHYGGWGFSFSVGFGWASWGMSLGWGYSYPAYGGWGPCCGWYGGYYPTYYYPSYYYPYYPAYGGYWGPAYSKGYPRPTYIAGGGRIPGPSPVYGVPRYKEDARRVAGRTTAPSSGTRVSPSSGRGAVAACSQARRSRRILTRIRMACSRLDSVIFFCIPFTPFSRIVNH